MEYFTSQGIIVTNRIFVGSIPDWMCENKLHLAFQDLNFNVQDTRIVVDMKTGKRKGYGFVTFYDAKDAEELIKKGFVVTNDGVKLKIDRAVRRKGMQLRLQKQNRFYQNVINEQVVHDHVIFFPSTQNNRIQQAQIPNGYQAMGNYPTHMPQTIPLQPSYVTLGKFRFQLGFTHS